MRFYKNIILSNLIMLLCLLWLYTNFVITNIESLSRQEHITLIGIFFSFYASATLITLIVYKLFGKDIYSRVALGITISFLMFYNYKVILVNALYFSAAAIFIF